MRLNRAKLTTPQLKDADFVRSIETMKEPDMLQPAVDLNNLVQP